MKKEKTIKNAKWIHTYFTKGVGMLHKYMKIFSILLVTWEMKIKTKWLHSSPERIDMTKNQALIGVCRACGQKKLTVLLNMKSTSTTMERRS